MDQRHFIREFKNRGEQALDNNEPFEAYIYLWLAFLQSCASDETKRIKSDRNDIIKPWNKLNFDSVYSLLGEHSLQDNLIWLANRQDKNILNPANRHWKDVQRLKRLSQVCRGEDDIMSTEETSYALLDLCISVRNNLFHGGKSFYNHNDRKLLENMCPILLALIEINSPD